MLDYTEETLDEIALAIEREVAIAFHFPIRFRRDDDLDRSRDQAVSEVICVITLVCEQSSGLDQPQQRLSLRDIVNLAASQDEPQRITKGIDDHVDFRREPTARAADGLVETPFLRAPAEC